MDKRLESRGVRLPSELLDDAEKLVDCARDWPQFEATQPTLTGILRLALKRGLAALKVEMKTT